jgi:hypothetical protein
MYPYKYGVVEIQIFSAVLAAHKDISIAAIFGEFLNKLVERGFSNRLPAT